MSEPNQWQLWQQQQLLAAQLQAAQQQPMAMYPMPPLYQQQFPQQLIGQQQMPQQLFGQQQMPQQLIGQQQMLHQMPFPMMINPPQAMFPLNPELHPMGFMPRTNEEHAVVEKCEDNKNEACKKDEKKRDGIKKFEENDETGIEEAPETETVACATAFKSLQSKKSKKKECEEEDEDFQSVKAFAASLKARASSEKKPKKVQSSSEEEEEPKRKKKRKVVYIDDEDEDEDEEDEDDEDESEDEVEDVPANKKKPAKGRKPAAATRGRKKGSVNVQPKKDELKAQLAAAKKKIKELEKERKKGTGSSRNSDPAGSSRVVFEYLDENYGIVPVTVRDDSDHEPLTSGPGTNGAAAASVLPDDDDEVWEVPPDDYGWLDDAKEPEKEIPFAPVQNVSHEREGPAICKACMVDPPTHIINPCSHVGLCNSCKDVYHFKSEMRCPGCGVKHLIVCKKFF